MKTTPHPTLVAALTAAALLLASLSPDGPGRPRIFMIGDSTMANKNLAGGNEERGWGQALSSSFDEGVEVHNHAVNGRSSKSFIDEGRWQAVLDSLREGDYLVIQFGHNDEKADPKRHTEAGGSYDDNLRLFVRGARARGATPIVCNSIVRRNFARVADAVAQDDHSGKSALAGQEGDTLYETHGAYLAAARRVAEQEACAFVDLNGATHDLVQGLGPIRSRELYLWSPPGRAAAYPQGKSDNTHLNPVGARLVAEMAARRMADQAPGLRAHLRTYDVVVAADGSGDFMTEADWRKANDKAADKANDSRAEAIYYDAPGLGKWAPGVGSPGRDLRVLIKR